MILQYNLRGPIPSKKNSRITVRATGRSFPSKKYSLWHKDSSRQMESQYKPYDPIKETKHILLEFTFGTRHRADLTNKAESVMDLLVDLGILKDDNFFICPQIVLTGKYEKDKAGVEVTIKV